MENIKNSEMISSKDEIIELIASKVCLFVLRKSLEPKGIEPLTQVVITGLDEFHYELKERVIEVLDQTITQLNSTKK